MMIGCKLTINDEITEKPNVSKTTGTVNKMKLVTVLCRMRLKHRRKYKIRKYLILVIH